ncbi:MAG: DUF4392 domain-containing protein [Alphaproteobacteria bacterium]|nr:DUF4392 domain-containing protein [Alphaproteobacteria bacterium]
MASSTAPTPERDAARRQIRLARATLDRQFAQAVRTLVRDGAARGAECLETRLSFGLPSLVRSLVGRESPPRLGVVTGFPIPRAGGGVTFENDGPIGAGHLAIAAAVLGWPLVFVLDADFACLAEAIADVARALGLPFDPLVVTMAGDGAPERRRVRAELEAFGLTHLFAIERPGAARDGFHYSMRAERLDGSFTPSDFLFRDAPWITAGFADGGNEIGMGRIGERRIARAITHGAVIASRTRVDHLTLCGVSNWGVYGLVAMLALAMPARRAALLRHFTPETDRLLFAALEKAGAVDGVTRATTASVDGLGLDIHHDKIRALVRLVAIHAGSRPA